MGVGADRVEERLCPPQHPYRPPWGGPHSPGGSLGWAVCLDAGELFVLRPPGAEGHWGVLKSLLNKRTAFSFSTGCAKQSEVCGAEGQASVWGTRVAVPALPQSRSLRHQFAGSKAGLKEYIRVS